MKTCIFEFQCINFTKTWSTEECVDTVYNRALHAPIPYTTSTLCTWCTRAKNACQI